MKKYIIIGLIGFITLTIGCSTSTPKTGAAQQQKHQISKQYTCTMHPEVIKDKPGVCPKCGMDLVEKEK